MGTPLNDGNSMFVRVTSTPNSPRKAIKVVESVREGFRVKQKVLCYIGIASDESEIDKLKQIGKEFIEREQRRRASDSQPPSLSEAHPSEEHGEKTGPLTTVKLGETKKGRKTRIHLTDVLSKDQLSLADLEEESRLVEGIHDIAGFVYDDLGYNTLLSRASDNELLRDLVLMRLANPSSKMSTKNTLQNHYARSHHLDSIYRVMDKVFPKIQNLKTMTFQKTKFLIPGKIDLLLFDCTTLYFESTVVDDLRKYGFSKDHRFNTTQVVLALATTRDGLPIGYELFEGNKAEVSTLLECIEKWNTSLDIERVCFVADRAMMSDKNLKSLEQKNYTYVVAAKLRALPDSLQEQLLLEKNYKIACFGDSIGWIGEFTYQNRRLIVSYKTTRAQRDFHQRAKIVEKIQKKLGKEGHTQKLITNQGVKKFTTSDRSKSKLSQNKIDYDAQWDGLHGIITNIQPKKTAEEIKLEKAEIEARLHKGLSAPEPERVEREEAVPLLLRYGRLWRIEESFRINKHTLSMRPIYHFKPERIQAHIAICYMAFSVLRHMEYKVQLTQKISLQELLAELTQIQSSFYRHKPTGKLYRMPGKFSSTARKIYKTFQVQRQNNAQVAQ